MIKSWQFWLLLALVGATLYITYRVATGLQAAQQQITGYTSPIKNFLTKLGL